jgi:cellulose synthase/poly-beta-1,6-N-acetylglucosamine synthase-like glycosyltransferase
LKKNNDHPGHSFSCLARETDVSPSAVETAVNRRVTFETSGSDHMMSLDILLSLDPISIALLFWFTLLFDLPRYVISLAVISILGRKKLFPVRLTTSAVVAGHNEARTIRRCVESIEADQIILVDDGSTDGMCGIVKQLKAEGLVDRIFCLPIRSSKITAINLALAECTGEIVFIIDADTVPSPDAIAAALPYFADPDAGQSAAISK